MVLAWVVHADVEVQLLLPEDKPVREPERVVPHGAREFVVHQREDRLDVAARQTLRRLLHRPTDYPGEAVTRAERPRAELRCNNVTFPIVTCIYGMLFIVLIIGLRFHLVALTFKAIIEINSIELDSERFRCFRWKCKL